MQQLDPQAKEQLQEIEKQLLANGFTVVKPLQEYDNGKCQVQILEEGYAIHSKLFTGASDFIDPITQTPEIWSMYSKDLQLYWLIGALIYNDFVTGWNKPE